MKHVKNFNDSDNNLNEFNNEKHTDIEPLTIEEFTNIREAMYSVRTSNSPSAFQAKPFFNNEENFKTIMSKLEKLLLYGSDKKIDDVVKGEKTFSISEKDLQKLIERIQDNIKNKTNKNGEYSLYMAISNSVKDTILTFFNKK